MRIAGLQKLTLLDYPGLLACTVFTCGCNFRCPFCHNASLVLPERRGEGLAAEEVLDFLRGRQGLLDGVVLSGGEPLLQEDLPAFLRRIRELGFPVKLDTNGSFPERLEELLAEGLLAYVAMDVKNAPALYAGTAGLSRLEIAKLERSRDLLLHGEIPYEFRTTVVRGLHTRESLLAAAGWIRGARAWYLQSFVDSGDLIAPEGLAAFSENEMHQLLLDVREVLPGAMLRNRPSL